MTTGPSAPSDAVEAILQRAFGLAEEGEWDEVAELLRESLNEHPDDPYLFCWLGMAERELGLDGIAYERFKRALSCEPQDPVLLSTAGTALSHFDDPEAEAALRTAALIAPELPQARWMFGAYLSREGMLEEALSELAAAEALAPDDPVILMELGVARALGGDLEGAAHAFARSLDSGPESDPWTLLLLGLARVELDEVEEAAPSLEEGARLRPDDLDAQLLAALALAAGGWEERALEMLERARLRTEETDLQAVLEVEERIEDGAEASLRFLRRSIGPSSFRERLMERP